MIRLQEKIMIKPMSAIKGMVINPNQFMYSPVQATGPHAAAASKMLANFWSE